MIWTCDFFLVREERLNTWEYQRFSKLYDPNRFNLLKVIREYQRLPLVCILLGVKWASDKNLWHPSVNVTPLYINYVRSQRIAGKSVYCLHILICVCACILRYTFTNVRKLNIYCMHISILTLVIYLVRGSYL